MFSDMPAEVRDSMKWRECSLYEVKPHDEHEWVLAGESMRCEGWVRPPLVERVFTWFGWEDGYGTNTLWSRAGGERHGPPYDELQAVMTPTHWGVGLDYQAYDKHKALGIQVGPFHLWLGRTW